ncbi:hypothetical protein GCM10010336_11210 [Streptomyces goshikiensis]|nr:hypothetical protein GCM10010336_11210 [Streptomyces goshikiensis]
MPQLAQIPGEDPVGEWLAVHQHAVVVEDDEVVAHVPTLRADSARQPGPHAGHPQDKRTISAPQPTQRRPGTSAGPGVARVAGRPLNAEKPRTSYLVRGFPQ